MLDYQGSIVQLLDYYQHNLISTLPELLINYGSLPFFLAAFYFAVKNQIYRHPFFLYLAAGGIVLILYYLFEANAIAQIHDYYLFVFYPFLFALVAYGIKQLLYSQPRKTVSIFSIFLLLALSVTCHLRMKNRWDPAHPRFNRLQPNCKQLFRIQALW